jgi:hypothetical protein
MAYIGNPPANRFVAPKAAKQFSGDGSTTAFTLDHAVGSDEDILVSVDGVIQEPSVAYAVSNGTTLTFTAAPSSNAGNNIFVYYLFRTVGTVSHPSNNALEATSGTFSGDVTVDTSTLKVDSTNNRVGVGTASPSQSLEVAGNIFVNTSGNPNLTVKTSGAGNNPTIRIQADTNYWDLQTLFSNSTDDLDFQYNGTSTMKIDNAGHITKPLQPAFCATPSANLENFAINQYNNVDFASERFDRNADYNAGGAPTSFTAPVTGVYQLNFHLYILSVDTAATYFQFSILTSNKEYTSIVDPNFSGDLGYYHMSLAVLADMDANDQAYVRVYQSGGAAQMDVAGNSSFSGYLVA